MDFGVGYKQITFDELSQAVYSCLRGYTAKTNLILDPNDLVIEINPHDDMSVRTSVRFPTALRLADGDTVLGIKVVRTADRPVGKPALVVKKEWAL